MRRFRPWLVRLAGMTLLALAGCWLLFGVLGKTDIRWALPWTKMFRAPWPDLPLFTARTVTAPDGQTETDYQVPSHILTRDEIAHLRYVPPATNAAPSASPAR